MLAEGSEEAALWAEVQQGVEEMSAQVAAMRPDLGVAAVLAASFRALSLKWLYRAVIFALLWVKSVCT